MPVWTKRLICNLQAIPIIHPSPRTRPLHQTVSPFKTGDRIRNAESIVGAFPAYSLAQKTVERPGALFDGL